MDLGTPRSLDPEVLFDTRVPRGTGVSSSKEINETESSRRSKLVVLTKQGIVSSAGSCKSRVVFLSESSLALEVVFSRPPLEHVSPCSQRRQDMQVNGRGRRRGIFTSERTSRFRFACTSVRKKC